VNPTDDSDLEEVYSFARDSQPETPLKEQRKLSQIDFGDLRERAALALSAQPRPFLRWAGSKRALLPHIVEALPRSYGMYHEPFLGSGALFFLLRPRRASLSDTCAELIQTFDAVREDVNAVLRHLSPLKPDRALFHAIRSNRSRGRFKRAAEFIYLNKTCWNGLYRVNSRGEFNVPYGRPKTDHIVDESNLRACSSTLGQGVVALQCRDFEVALRTVLPGDLVFLDPPYVTRHNGNGFIDYNEQLFSWADQVRLARVSQDLIDQGAHVLVTNAFHREVIELYDGFNVLPINRASTLASDASKRSRVNEALLWRHPSEAQVG
jgi:DNA adenine methylase